MFMKKLLLIATILAAAPTLALAQSSQRAGRNEIYFGPVFVDTKSYSFEGGSTARTDTGYGLLFGWARNLNPHVALATVNDRVGTANAQALVDAHDVVVDGSDNFGTRFAVNAACVATRTPLVSGAALRFEGQLAVFRPDLVDSPCYRCLYGESDEALENCRNNGVLAPLVGVIGSLMAVEAVKIIVALGTDSPGRLVLYDARTLRWRDWKAQPRKVSPWSGAPGPEAASWTAM